MEINKDVDKTIPSQCICRDCPAYEDCQDHPTFYLIRANKCIANDRGCLCRSCLLYEKKGCTRRFF